MAPSGLTIQNKTYSIYFKLQYLLFALFVLGELKWVVNEQKFAI